MAMSVAITNQTHQYIKWVKFTWTSAAGGTATGTTTPVISGHILRLTTDPDATDVPTAAYDITVTDDLGVDCLQGLGANRSATDIENVSIVHSGQSTNPPVSSQLTINVSAAGDTKKGVATLFYIGEAKG